MKSSETMNAIEILKLHSIRPSQQRLAIMEYLIEHPYHNTIDDIMAGMKRASTPFARTIMENTLKLFVRKGALSAISTGAGNEHYDHNVGTHAHFLCRECDTMTDLKLEKDIEQAIAQKAKEINVASDPQIIVRGLCLKCADAARKKSLIQEYQS